MELNNCCRIHRIVNIYGQSRCFSVTLVQCKQKEKIPLVTKRVEDVGKSLATKGFLRPFKAYVAPSDAADKVKAICKSLQPSIADYTFKSTEQKFKLLETCYREFKHGVPNSQVHEINTVADVISFYQTSVNTTVPYDSLKNVDLPQNLHIQYDYVRFHPDTDTKFNGRTAFPKSSTLVTGLKYRNKYQGHQVKTSWP